MVFPSAVEALLEPGVGPHALHGGEKLCRVRLRVLHTGDHIAHQLGIGLDQHVSEGQRMRSKLISVV